MPCSCLTVLVILKISFYFLTIQIYSKFIEEWTLIKVLSNHSHTTKYGAQSILFNDSSKCFPDIILTISLILYSLWLLLWSCPYTYHLVSHPILIYFDVQLIVVELHFLLSKQYCSFLSVFFFCKFASFPSFSFSFTVPFLLQLFFPCKNYPSANSLWEPSSLFL